MCSFIYVVRETPVRYEHNAENEKGRKLQAQRSCSSLLELDAAFHLHFPSFSPCDFTLT